jgi:hypothetical protein
MGFEQPTPLTPEEMAKIEKERALSDAEFLEGGAEYKINEQGEKQLEMTREQRERAQDEMINDKIEKLTTEEKSLFIADQGITNSMSKIDSLMHEGKIDKQTRDSLFRDLNDTREMAKEGFKDKLGDEKVKEVTELQYDNFRRNIRDSIKGAQNFDELFATINRSGGIQGEKEFFEVGQLKNYIERVRGHRDKIGMVTRADGLRKKVYELIQKEQGK